MSGQSADRKNYDQWFVKVLEPLMHDPNAGFLCAIAAFPLLERYLTRKCGHSYRTASFKDALVEFLPELKGHTKDKSRANAKEFWEIYRHGLLHNIRLKRQVWLSHATKIIEKRPEGFWLNPVLFLKRVLGEIGQHFETFAKEPGLPQVHDVAVQNRVTHAPVDQPAPQPGLNFVEVKVLSTGSRR